MKILLLVLLCSTVIFATDDIKSAETEATEKPTEKSSEKPEKNELVKTEKEKPPISEICKKCDCELEAKTE